MQPAPRSPFHRFKVAAGKDLSSESSRNTPEAGAIPHHSMQRDQN